MAGRYFNPTKEETEEISRDPYITQMVKKVKAFAYLHCQTKNLYAWREFIADLQADLELFIYDYELAHKKGLYRKTGYAAYCNAAKQQALNWVAYYSAHKRKVNCETLSIDASEEDENRPSIQIAAENTYMEEFIALDSIASEYGEVAENLCERLLKGEALNKADIKRLRALPNMRAFLSN